MTRRRPCAEGRHPVWRQPFVPVENLIVADHHPASPRGRARHCSGGMGCRYDRALRPRSRSPRLRFHASSGARITVVGSNLLTDRIRLALVLGGGRDTCVSLERPRSDRIRRRFGASWAFQSPAGYRIVLPASRPNPLVQIPLWISPDSPQPSVTGAVHSAQVTVFPMFHAQKFHGPS